MPRLLRKLHGIDPITIVLDNAAYQKCGLVTDLAKELKIKLLYLPSYSPNLNLIERLWKFVKKKSLNNTYYETFELFKSGITRCLEEVNSSYHAELVSLMTLKFHIVKNDRFLAG